MYKKVTRARKGFTLVELMITTVIMLIVGLAIGVVIVDGQTGWNTMYNRMNSDVVTDGYVARKKFDNVMRSASRQQSLLAADGSWIEVYYYASPSSAVLDRYARFYMADGDLNLEYGQIDPRSTLRVETVCENVSACTFEQAGTSIQMILTLGNETQTNTIVSSAITHNQ
ncbi:MAG: PilW family protein [Planctomycetota bacterium]|jgi:prepilin-type N-terminal cleavage/methylation domain-containing protein